MEWSKTRELQKCTKHNYDNYYNNHDHYTETIYFTVIEHQALRLGRLNFNFIIEGILYSCHL